jgi:hypothetical protein
MLSFAIGIPLLTGIGWNAPRACPTEDSFRQLVEARLGGESPEQYSTDVDAWVREFGNGGYELALQAMHDSFGPIQFTTVNVDCEELTNFAAAWTATQIDPLGVGPKIDPAPEPPPELVPSPVPAPPELGPPELGPPELGPPELDQPELGPPELGPPELNQAADLTAAEDQPALSGLLGTSTGFALGFSSSPVVTAVTARAGLKWRSLQVTVGGHSFVDSALSRVRDSPIEPRTLVVWSVGPELCWAPRIERLLLWGCGNYDAGQLHLVTNLPTPVRARWSRAGLSVGVGFQAGRWLQPFLSVGFSHVISDVLILVNDDPLIRKIGTFASLGIGGNFILRSNRAKP